MNTQLITIIIIGVFVSLLLISIALLGLAFGLKRYVKNKENEFAVRLASKGKNTAFEIIDTRLKESFSMYIIMHPELDNGTAPLTDEKQKQIVRDLVYDVITTVSPYVIDFLSIHINSKELTNVMSKRAMVLVIDYAISKNTEM